MRRRTRFLCGTGVLMLAGVVTAAAQDAELRRLRGEIRPGYRAFDVVAEYDVRVEEPRWGAAYDLVLYATDQGRIVRDARGRPLQVVVPLDRPRWTDDDELSFRGRVRLDVRRAAIAEPKELRLHGVVLLAGTDYVLDRRDTRMRLRGF